MTQEIWHPFAEGQPIQTVLPGRFVYFQGTEATQFYYIVSGSVKCFISSDTGDERTLTIHRQGDFMGEAAFFDGQPRVSSAVAVTKSEIVAINRERLTAVFAAHPDLALSMLQYLARTIRLLSEHVDNMSFLRADQQVARHLISLYKGDPRLSCTHEELGTAVGVSRVTVSRVLGAFSKQGFITTGYRTVTLLNPDALMDVFQS